MKAKEIRNSFKYLIIGVLFCSLVFAHAIAGAAPGKDSDPETIRVYNVLYAHIGRVSKLGPEWSDWLAHSLLLLGNKWGIHPFLIASLYTQESSFRPDAISPAGAVGIAQLMPTTAAGMGVDPYDPAQNLEAGVAYLAEQLRSFSGAGEWTVSYAVAAYNAGPNAISKHGGIPPYEETINHVNKIAAIYQGLIDDYNATL